jgi:hypothetical protein
MRKIMFKGNEFKLYLEETKQLTQHHLHLLQILQNSLIISRSTILLYDKSGKILIPSKRHIIFIIFKI